MKEEAPLEEQQPQAAAIPWVVAGFLAGSREGRAARAHQDHLLLSCEAGTFREAKAKEATTSTGKNGSAQDSCVRHYPSNAPEAPGLLGNYRNANRQRGEG